MPKLLLIKLFLPIFVVSCSSLPRSDWVVNPDFMLEGRIGVRGLDRATSSSIRWLQSGSNFEMTLWGPFGQGKTRLVGDAALITVQKANGERFAGVVPDEILEQQFGISASIDAFSIWVLGRPKIRPPAQDLERDEYGDVITFKQLGFDLAYGDYRVVGGRRVPHRITCLEGGTKITLLVERWTLAEAL